MPLSPIQIQYLAPGASMYSDAGSDSSSALKSVGGSLVLRLPGSSLSWRVDYVDRDDLVGPWRVLAPDEHGDSHQSIERYRTFRDALSVAKRCVRADVRQLDGELYDPKHKTLL